ncbi:MAG: response regulator transcription factor [Rubripirellula sp.]
MTLRVLIVDDHEVARNGISDLLQAQGFSVAGSVSSGDEALVHLDEDSNVDLVLLDIQMPKLDGLNVLQKFQAKHESVKVVVMSAYDNPTYIARAAALGAADYLLKGVSYEKMHDALSCVAGGLDRPSESRLEKISNLMRQEIDPKDLPPELPLTGREAQVLRHMALGLSNKEIAKSLGISVETAKEHVQNILRKVGATDRTDAAVRAVKLGLAD